MKARAAAGLAMLDRRAAEGVEAVVLDTRARVPRTAGLTARVSEDDIVRRALSRREDSLVGGEVGGRLHNVTRLATESSRWQERDGKTRSLGKYRRFISVQRKTHMELRLERLKNGPSSAEGSHQCPSADFVGQAILG